MSTTLAVHLARSYDRLVKSVRAAEGQPDDTHLEVLGRAALGDWARVTDETRTGTKLIAGVYEGLICGIYTVTGSNRDLETGRVRFDGKLSDQHAHHIGTEVEGGRWKRGEARPIRAIHDLPGDPSNPEGAARRRALELLHSRANPPSSSKDLLDMVRVTRNEHEGGIIVEIPAGVRVAVVPYDPAEN